MTTLNLGKVRIAWRGTWDILTDYVVFDGVLHNGSSYVAITDPPIGSVPPSQPLEWQLQASVGADGADGADGSDGSDGRNFDDPPPAFVAGSPEGVGNCQLTDGVWFPPNGADPGSFTGWVGHPCPQPHPGGGSSFFGSTQSTSGDTTTVITPEGQHPAVSPFDEPPGSNFLNTVNSNLFDFLGNEMQNNKKWGRDCEKYDQRHANKLIQCWLPLLGGCSIG